MSLTLRKASAGDAYALWMWANDPETRTASFDRPTIAWSQHVRWLGSQIASPDALVLVAVAGDDQPVGSIRFDTADDWRTARLSYVVAPEARGAGIGSSLVREGVLRLRSEHADATITALVRAGNPASLHIFRRMGWSESGVLHEQHDAHLFTSGGRENE